MQGGNCSYELRNGIWVVVHSCGPGKNCMVPTPSTLPLSKNIPDDAAAGNSPFHPITFTSALTVKVDKHLIGKTVKVSNGMTRTSADGDTAWEYSKPAACTNLRFVVVIACDGALAFGAESFDASTLPAPP